MKSKVSIEVIQELRKLIPVGMLDAKRLLEMNNNDLEKARSQFITEEVKTLCIRTSEKEELVAELFFEQEYDKNKTKDRIDDVVYDRNFISMNLKTTPHDLNMVEAWLVTIQSFGLMNSLQTANFDCIVLVIKELGLEKFSKELEEAHAFLDQKEQEFQELTEDELIEAVDQLKISKEYKKVLESYKMNIALNPDFFKVLARMKKNVMKI